MKPFGPRERRAAWLCWTRASATLLLGLIGNVEAPSWQGHPAAPLAYLVVLGAYLSLPILPLAWFIALVRAGTERGQVAVYGALAAIFWVFQGLALLPYVQ